MSNFVPSKQHMREVLLHYFVLKKTAADSYRLLSEAYGVYALSESTCREWFQRFKSGDYGVNDKERPGQPKKFEDHDLEALLEEDPSQTLKDLAETLKVTHVAVFKRLKTLGIIQKQGNWIPHALTPRDMEQRFSICNLLLQRQKRKNFLPRIVTGDEKWIRYNNHKRKKYRSKRGKHVALALTSTPKPNIHGSKVMLSIWWDQKGVIYYEILKPGEMITGDRYRSQLLHLNQALQEKRQKNRIKHNKVILLHDNARPHCANQVKETLETLNWEVLPHPPYSPDIAPSDFHLFRSMTHSLSYQDFQSFGDIQKWLDSWIASKDQSFFGRGIGLLPERWNKVVASNGQYFE